MSRSLSYGELVFLARDILAIAERKRSEELQATHDAAVALCEAGVGGEFKLYREGDDRVVGRFRIGEPYSWSFPL